MSSKIFYFLVTVLATLSGCYHGSYLEELESPILFKGDEKTGYRDPAVLYHQDTLYLFFTLTKIEHDTVFSYTAMISSADLKEWSPVKILTPRDQRLNFSSPGNVVRYNDEWVLCLQTYPRPDYTADQGIRYGTEDARIYTMRSKDLKNWTDPQLMRVKGADVPFEEMRRMIDPYLIEDKNEPGKWWCFYKQNGVSMSYSFDLQNWKFHGYTQSGENVCVLVEDNEYILFHSPKNGIAIMRSPDLVSWEPWGNLITLDQHNWDWAKGRITAGVVLNLKNNEKFGKYVMFYHGSGPLTEEEGDFDKNASIGIAWSEDLLNWEWPGK